MLSSILRRIDSRGYKAYRELLGKREKIKNFELQFVKIQGDPYASPSVVSITVPFSMPDYAKSPVGVEDFFYRRLFRSLSKRKKICGEGHSGFLGVPKPKNVMIKRSGVLLRKNIEFRFWVGLPSKHRRILGDEAERIIYEKIPEAIDEILQFEEEKMKKHVEAYEIQEEMRNKLKENGLVAFVANGSVLPRKCGDCEEPLENAVKFESPSSLLVEMETSYGVFEGMGIPEGTTVIAGTAFHGKSTLLNAIRDGIYNHIPGDGREKVITIKNSFKIRAEDGRSIRCVDISTFLHNLPDGRDTKYFTTSNASGATSMAAGIQESVEAGAELLLIDEDTSATNLLFYDERTAHLFRHKTTSTVAEKARAIAEKGISLIIVSSGSEPLIESADTVIVMEDYIPRKIECEKREKYEDYRPPACRILAQVPNFEKVKVKASWLTSKNLTRVVHMENDEQIKEDSQLNFLAHILSQSRMLEGKNFEEISKIIDEKMNRFPDAFGKNYGPNFSEIRGIDFVFALNRVQEIRVSQK